MLALKTKASEVDGRVICKSKATRFDRPLMKHSLIAHACMLAFALTYASSSTRWPLMAVFPLHDTFRVKFVIVSSCYQFLCKVYVKICDGHGAVAIS